MSSSLLSHLSHRSVENILSEHLVDLHLPNCSGIILKDFGDLIHPVDGSNGPLAPVAHYDILVVLDLL